MEVRIQEKPLPSGGISFRLKTNSAHGQPTPNHRPLPPPQSHIHNLNPCAPFHPIRVLHLAASRPQKQRNKRKTIECDKRLRDPRVRVQTHFLSQPQLQLQPPHLPKTQHQPLPQPPCTPTSLPTPTPTSNLNPARHQREMPQGSGPSPFHPAPGNAPEKTPPSKEAR